MKKLIAIFLLCAVTVQAEIDPITMSWYQRVCALPKVSAGGGGLLYQVFESATMTASNAPAPVMIIADSTYSTYYPFNAFNKDGQTGRWLANPLDTNRHWIIYDCGSGVSNVATRIFLQVYAAGNVWKTFDVYGSQDYANWTMALDATIQTVAKQGFNITAPAFYRYYRVAVSNALGGNTQIGEIELSSCVWDGIPMTASNTPSPLVVTSSTYVGTYEPWKMFDRDNGTWASSVGKSNWWAIDYGSNIAMNGFTIINLGGSSGSRDIFVYKSDDNFTNLTLVNTGTLSNLLTATVFTNATVTARYWKIDVTNSWGANATIVDWIPKIRK